jgi:hypothetical protein
MSKTIEDDWPPELIAIVWENLPTPIEIDYEDEEAILRLLTAIAMYIRNQRQ